MALRGGPEAAAASADVARPLAELEQAVRSATIARVVQTAVEPDRAMLAYAIHDGLTQVVTASVLELEALARRVEVDPSETTHALHEAIVELRHALGEIRDVLATLTPAATTTGETLERSVRRALERWQLAATWSVDGDLSSVPATALEIAAAVIREAVANAAKHANTDRVWIGLRVSDVELEVTVEDHGTGFDETPPVPGHLGLGMLRRRVGDANGTLVVGPAPGGGTVVAACLPIARQGGSS
jgi:signal transduction histidine kinase